MNKFIDISFDFRTDTPEGKDDEYRFYKSSAINFVKKRNQRIVENK
jgi:hypothetical protein